MSAVQLYPLHNPGCGTPGELCGPHPMSPIEVIHQPELFVAWLGITAIVVLIGLYRRSRYQRNDEH